MPPTDTLRSEFRPLWKLAGPLVLAELGWMVMGIVDTMMVGRLPSSAEAIGAVSLGHVLFLAVGIFGGGLLLGLDTLVSQAFGAGRVNECHRLLLRMPPPAPQQCLPLSGSDPCPHGSGLALWVGVTAGRHSS
jgi:MATE family multidrug resistance protein